MTKKTQNKIKDNSKPKKLKKQNKNIFHPLQESPDLKINSTIYLIDAILISLKTVMTKTFLPQKKPLSNQKPITFISRLIISNFVTFFHTALKFCWMQFPPTGYSIVSSYCTQTFVYLKYYAVYSNVYISQRKSNSPADLLKQNS